MVSVGYSACEGDLNCDGDADGSDLVMFAANFPPSAEALKTRPVTIVLPSLEIVEECTLKAIVSTSQFDHLEGAGP